MPVIFRVAALVGCTSWFYAHIGQWVPQIEIHPPPIEETSANLSAETQVSLGQEIFNGRGGCTICHTLGKTAGPFVFPDLQGVGLRAETRISGMSARDYLRQSLYEPTAFVVEGFAPSMPAVSGPPSNLSESDTQAVVSYLLSLQGESVNALSAATLPASEGSETLSGEPSEPTAVAEAAPSSPGQEPVSDQAPTPQDRPGDADSALRSEGAVLYARICVVCHGESGEGKDIMNSPGLAGQQDWYIARQLRNFREGIRGTDAKDLYGMQMRPMALTLAGDEDIEALAAYLSALPPAGK